MRASPGREPEKMKEEKPTFALTLEAVPGSDVPAAIRLKRFLKSALRAYGLRCTRAEEIHPAAALDRLNLDQAPPAEPRELLDYRPASWELSTKSQPLCQHLAEKP